MERREIVAKYLHNARCSGCVNGRYSGEHKPNPASRDTDLREADALLAELETAEGAR